MLRLISSILTRLRLTVWRNAKPGRDALIPPLSMRLDPGMRK